MTQRELPFFHRLVIWVTSAQEYKSSLILLNKRIVQLVKTNGFQFTFLYLKETARLTIRALGGSPEQASGEAQVRVSRDPRGYPTVIPLKLRRLFGAHQGKENVVRATLTLLTVFRTFPTKVKPSLDTITGAFDGITRTLDSQAIRKAVKSLKLRASFGKFKGFLATSAGPNCHFSTWGAGIDALALMLHPKQASAFVRLAVSSRSYGYLAWFIVLNLIAGPLYALLRATRLLGEPLKLGRLSVVYDQAGKARVVAITNWWIQLALRPLHDSMFRAVRKIPMDGTFDQEAPLKRLISLEPNGHLFHSLDLSAATDRLPIDVQVQVLEHSGVREAELWRQLLSVPWAYNKEVVYYSVGQPMGAYSSWSTLAFTHHVIVQVAATRCGLNSFDRYAVLGDDVVINHDGVAAEYLELMKALGVSIQLSKSIVSKDTIEFAKRWFHQGVDLSPLGAGNILQTMRRPYFVGSLLREADQKSYTDLSKTVLGIKTAKGIGFKKIPNNLVAFIFWTAFGLKGFTHDRGQVDTKVLTWCAHGGVTANPELFRYSFYNGLLTALLREAREALRKLDTEETFFYRNWYRMTGQSSWSMRLLESLLVLFAPGFWLYAYSFVLTREELKPPYRNCKGTWADIAELSELAQSKYLTVNWFERTAVRGHIKFFLRLERDILQSAEDMMFFEGEEGLY